MLSTRHWPILVVFGALMSLGGGMVRAGQAACGDDQLVCGSDEKCCEHRVATFCENEGCSTVHVEGACIVKEASCDEFWCGNRQCQKGWLMSKNVCCIYYQGNSPEYSCAHTELNCPGNTTQLSIRPPVTALRTLQGS